MIHAGPVAERDDTEACFWVFALKWHNKVRIVGLEDFNRIPHTRSTIVSELVGRRPDEIALQGLLTQDKVEETSNDVDVKDEHDSEEDRTVTGFGLFAVVEGFQDFWDTLHTDQL